MEPQLEHSHQAESRSLPAGSLPVLGNDCFLSQVVELWGDLLRGAVPAQLTATASPESATSQLCTASLYLDVFPMQTCPFMGEGGPPVAQERRNKERGSAFSPSFLAANHCPRP